MSYNISNNMSNNTSKSFNQPQSMKASKVLMSHHIYLQV
jgi:hypothetical protein